MKLNTEILCKFPRKIREHMQPMEYGDLLRIPTEQEIFGENKYGEADSAEQWLCMKKRRNRMALCEEELCWYWLQNRYPETLIAFAPSTASEVRAQTPLVILMAFARYFFYPTDMGRRRQKNES